MMAARFQPKNNNKKCCFLLFQEDERPTLSSPIKGLHDGRSEVSFFLKTEISGELEGI